MVKKLTELEQLKLKVSNYEYQIKEYQEIVAELSKQLKEYKDTAEFNKSFEVNSK